MTDQNYTPQNQIINIFPTSKTGLCIRDSLGLDDPKIHFQLFPTKLGTGSKVEFWVNVHAARTLFTGCRTGRMAELVAGHNKKNDPGVGFDLYAKMSAGYRTLTLRPQDNGAWLSVVNKNAGQENRQSVFLPAFTLATISLAVLAYLDDYGAVKLSRRYVPQETGENSTSGQENGQGATPEPVRPEYELVLTPHGNYIGDLTNDQLTLLGRSNAEGVTENMRSAARMVLQDRTGSNGQ